MEELILPSEKFLARNNEECFDLVLSGIHRREIFDKLIGRRYELITSKIANVETEEHCQIDFITTYNKNKNETQIALGEFSKAKKANEKTQVNTNQSMMVQKSYPANFKVGENQLNIKCEKLPNDQFLLTIGHEHSLGSVSTTARVIRGVKFNLASSVRELNDKKSTLGIPQSEWLKTEGLENTNYELVVQ